MPSRACKTHDKFCMGRILRRISTWELIFTLAKTTYKAVHLSPSRNYSSQEQFYLTFACMRLSLPYISWSFESSCQLTSPYAGTSSLNTFSSASAASSSFFRFLFFFPKENDTLSSLGRDGSIPFATSSLYSENV